MQDVLDFLKSGRKPPTHFANLDKTKCLHRLSEYSRNFKYEGVHGVNIPLQFDKHFIFVRFFIKKCFNFLSYQYYSCFYSLS